MYFSVNTSYKVIDEKNMDNIGLYLRYAGKSS